MLMQCRESQSLADLVRAVSEVDSRLAKWLGSDHAGNDVVVTAALVGWYLAHRSPADLINK